MISFTNDPSCVLYLPMQEGSGTTVYDYSGNSNDGTTNADWVKTTFNGRYAQDFNGSSDYINLGDLDVSGDKITINAWVYLDSTTAEGGIVTKMGGAGKTDYQFTLGCRNGIIYFAVQAGAWESAYFTNSPTQPSGEWVMVTSVYNGTDLKIYRNATLEDTQSSISGNMVQNNYNLYVGYYERDGDYLNGRVADVTIFNEDKSIDWIKQVYRQTYRV